VSDEKKRVYLYGGKNAEVAWDERLCIHVGECGRAKNDLFINGRDPWCAPDLVGIDDAIDVVSRCPSGALSVRSKDVKSETPDAQNVVVVSNNGPLYVRGELAITGAPEDMPGVRFRAALCRCGRSENKPFCDNTHEAIAFHDRGAIGEAGNLFEVAGGVLTIEPTRNGPLRLSGSFTMIAASGRTAFRGTKASLCRCGQSSNKPFCDGSHKASGFTAE
jgi:CDGSH-type Zn-finger protein/uncharacterized Fe-S cluster protein YjdI